MPVTAARQAPLWPASMLGRLQATRALVLALAVLALVGCAANARVDARVDQIAARLAEVERLDAMRCAPRELAIAQSQLEFARLEREQGDTAQSLMHLDVADDNVRAARLLAAPGRCSTPSEAASPRPLPALAAPAH